MTKLIDMVVDVESDGPAPGLYSMISFGAAFHDGTRIRTYDSGIIQPLEGARQGIPGALAVTGVTRQDQLKGVMPYDAIQNFRAWLNTEMGETRVIFWSDNLAFDWQWMNYYLHAFSNDNPFGFSGRRIGDFYAGLVKDIRAASKWKRYRVTPHTHNPADDAKGNLEALMQIKKIYGIK